MKHRTLKRISRRWLTMAGAIALCTVLLPVTAAAAGHRDRDHDRRDRHHRADRDRHHRHDRHHRFDHRRHHKHKRFVVPRRIHRHHHDHYRPYYWGRRFHAGHRHHHVIYRFPIYTDYGVYYEYYPYCGSELYIADDRGRLSIHGRRFHLDIGF